MIKSILKRILWGLFTPVYTTPVNSQFNDDHGYAEIQFLDQGGNWRTAGTTPNITPMIQSAMQSAVQTYGGRVRAVHLQTGQLIDIL